MTSLSQLGGSAEPSPLTGLVVKLPVNPFLRSLRLNELQPRHASGRRLEHALEALAEVTPERLRALPLEPGDERLVVRGHPAPATTSAAAGGRRARSSPARVAYAARGARSLPEASTIDPVQRGVEVGDRPARVGRDRAQARGQALDGAGVLPRGVARRSARAPDEQPRPRAPSAAPRGRRAPPRPSCATRAPRCGSRTTIPSAARAAQRGAKGVPRHLVTLCELDLAQRLPGLERAVENLRPERVGESVDDGHASKRGHGSVTAAGARAGRRAGIASATSPARTSAAPSAAGAPSRSSRIQDAEHRRGHGLGQKDGRRLGGASRRAARGRTAGMRRR